MKFETLKIYIKTILVNNFIGLSKFTAGVSIFFVKKPAGSLWLYVNYKGLNNLMIKN